MANLPNSDILIPASAPEAHGASPDHWMTELGTLLQEFESVAPVGKSLPATPEESTDDQLAKRRLGIAASLFAALQCKHAATASHSIRVALTCSAWSMRLDFDERQREQLEIAAVLHDIGVVGTPDHILLKPTRLDGDEAEIMSQARTMSPEILRRSCNSTEILAIVEHVPAWYDGSRGNSTLLGEQIPLAARMIAVAEAFDAMTTDRVYRPALSQERAMAELFRCAGSQFDPILVRQFVEMLEGDRGQLRKQVAARWLHALDPQAANSYWDLTAAPAATAQSGTARFEAKLLDNMYDAVIFIDSKGRIVQWNHGAERLTGIAGASIRQQRWHPDILKLSDEKNRSISEVDCPVLAAISSGVQSLRRLTVWGRNGRSVAVDSHVIPVIRSDGSTEGAVLLLHDASSEISLGAALPEPGRQGQPRPADAGGQPCRVRPRACHVRHRPPAAAGSLRLLMCDLDRFKQVNDTYGHQAGDEAIKSLARLAQGRLPPGRPGGPLRRRRIRYAPGRLRQHHGCPPRRTDSPARSAQLPQPQWMATPITVSFGVTEIQPGDTADTMLRRADRALLMAKKTAATRSCNWAAGWTRGWSRPPQAMRRPRPIRAWSFSRQWLRPCRSRWRSKNCADSWPTMTRKFSRSTATISNWKLPSVR